MMRHLLRSRRGSKVVLVIGLLLLGWAYRTRILRFLAPVESDYTTGAQLAPTYPRPNADLSPLWTAELEPGFGGAAIADGEVLVLDSEAGVGDNLRAFNLATGHELWSFGYPAPGRLEFPGSRTTPIVAGELVYTCGPFGQVNCVDRRTRRSVWELDLERDCGGEQPTFGWSASPLVLEELVILPALGPEVGLVALDRFTGELRWRTGALGASQSTPVVLELLGASQLLFLSSEVEGLGAEVPTPMTVSAFDPSSGTKLWQVRTLLTRVPIPPPVRVDEERFFLTGGYRGGSTMMRIERDGEGYAIREEFHVGKGSQLHPPVVRDGHVYLLANENSNDSPLRRDQGGLVCLDLEGRELWSTGSDPYFGRGHALALGGDYLLIQDGLSGILRLLRASPAGHELIATANVFASPPKAREKMWAPMVREGDILIARGETQLCCVRLGDATSDR